MPRGKDTKPRRVAVLQRHPDAKKLAITDPEPKKFLDMFIDKMQTELLAFTEDRQSLYELDENGVMTNPSGGKYKMSPREIAMTGIEYFRGCLAYNQPITRSGLSMFIGCGGTTGLNRYKGFEYFREVIEVLTGFVEMYNETALHTRQNPIGAIFVLKNMGWSDNMDLNIKGIPNLSVEERLAAKDRIKNFSE